MDRSAAVAIIKRGLGYRQTQDSTIIDALQAAQRDAEAGKTLPIWLLSYDRQIAVNAGDSLLRMPPNFLRMHDDYDLYYKNGLGGQTFIPRRNYTEAYQAYVANGTSCDVPAPPTNYPQVWVLQNRGQGMFIPTPQVSFTAYMTYYIADATLDADIQNAWLLNAPNYLIGKAGQAVAENLRDAAAFQKFSRMAKEGFAAMFGDIIETELAGRSLIMGRNN